MINFNTVDYIKLIIMRIITIKDYIKLNFMICYYYYYQNYEQNVKFIKNENDYYYFNPFNPHQ